MFNRRNNEVKILLKPCYTFVDISSSFSHCVIFISDIQETIYFGRLL